MATKFNHKNHCQPQKHQHMATKFKMTTLRQHNLCIIVNAYKDTFRRTKIESKPHLPNSTRERERENPILKSYLKRPRNPSCDPRARPDHRVPPYRTDRSPAGTAWCEIRNRRHFKRRRLCWNRKIFQRKDPNDNFVLMKRESEKEREMERKQMEETN